MARGKKHQVVAEEVDQTLNKAVIAYQASQRTEDPKDCVIADEYGVDHVQLWRQWKNMSMMSSRLSKRLDRNRYPTVFEPIGSVFRIGFVSSLDRIQPCPNRIVFFDDLNRYIRYSQTYPRKGM